ncbi:MAG TPA: hypothetical protein VM223_26590 [Planctomycetota bacterium]|nr:hypothetical protein [Planctomycetota bacterium]
MNSIGLPLLRQRLRVENVTVTIPDGKAHVRFELDDPAVAEPKRCAPVNWTTSRANVSPAEM